MVPLATTIFLGAFLLFQVQPMIARYILPWFGGSPAVWTTAMLFFQVMLLAGYAYTHFIVGRLGLKRQVVVHLLLLAITLTLLPITPAETWKPVGGENPRWQILLLLFFSVGMPYLLASSTAPLMQAWFTRIYPDRSPYGLYALSNTGSVLGLLVYPFLVEPTLGVRVQTIMWSFGYALFVAVSLWTALPMYRLATQETTSPGPTEKTPVPLARQLAWLFMSALGVVVLLAATNQLCKDVAVIPLLWILPLALYLVSFIVTFGLPQLYYRPFWSALLVVSIAAVVYLLHQDYADEEVNLYLQILIYSATVFSCCIICHGELYRLRPPENQLTLYYLMLSLGGALGGLFVNLAAPDLFLGYWEFHGSLVATLLLLGVCVLRDRQALPQRWMRPALGSGWVAGLVVLAYFLGTHIQSQQEETIETRRNFYGVLRIYEYDVGSRQHSRFLYHGRINHGSQYMHDRYRWRAVSYYGPRSGIALAFRTKRAQLRSQDRGGMQVGVIGQGSSSLASYAKAGDTIRFYESDPDVAEISDAFFTYLGESQAETEVIIGDARISMEVELKQGAAQAYDLLAVDAFSGDGIPVHLLTREALSLYKQHLAPDGIIAIHISNLHFDLRPVVRALAADGGMQAAWIEDWGEGFAEQSNDWVLLTREPRLATLLDRKAEEWPEAEPQKVLWTDDYANVLKVVW